MKCTIIFKRFEELVSFPIYKSKYLIFDTKAWVWRWLRSVEIYIKRNLNLFSWITLNLSSWSWAVPKLNFMEYSVALSVIVHININSFWSKSLILTHFVVNHTCKPNQSETMYHLNHFRCKIIIIIDLKFGMKKILNFLTGYFKILETPP